MDLEGVDHVSEGESPEPDMPQPEMFLEFRTKQICHKNVVRVRQLCYHLARMQLAATMWM